MSVPIFDQFSADWQFKGESNDKIKGGAIQAYPDYSCIFQLAHLADTNVRIAFPPCPNYDESKNVNNKRPVYTAEMPEMQQYFGQVSYSIGDKKLQEFFRVTFPEQAIDRAIKFSRTDSKLQKRLAELVRDKNLSELEMKKKLLDKVRPVLSDGKNGYDPVLHTKVDWKDPSKAYSTKWIVTRPELLAMSPPQMDDSEKLSDLKLYQLAAKPWQGCKAIPVIAFAQLTISKGNEIFLKFSTRTLLIIEGTSNASAGTLLNLGATSTGSSSSSSTSLTPSVTPQSAMTSPSAQGAASASPQPAASPTPAPAATPVTDKVKSEEVKPMAPPASPAQQPAAVVKDKEKPKPKSEKTKKSSVMADVDEN